MMQEQISKDMTIDEIFATFPHKSQKLAQAMQSKGLHCVGCHASTWETLEMGTLGHGMDHEDLSDLVDELNAILAEKLDTSTISITPKAAKKYLEILKEDGKEGYGLRFMEKAAGCSGFEYTLDFSEKAKENDVVFHSNNLEIHVPNTLVSRLMGSEIDYIDGLHGAGFKVSNPNVKSSCGCGSSHNY